MSSNKKKISRKKRDPSTRALARASNGLVLHYWGEYVPERFRTKIRYTEMWKDTTETGHNYYMYRGADVYDPYAGAGGQGCYGFDELTAIWQWYRVYQSWITLELVNAGTAPLNAFLYPFYSSASPTLAASEAAPNVRQAMLNCSAGKSVILRHHAMTKDFTSNPEDEDWTAAYNASPAKNWFHIMYFHNTDASALALTLKVSIVFDVEFSKKRQLDDA